MGTPAVYAAAAWLAGKGDGLVGADGQGWTRLTDWGEVVVLVPEWARGRLPASATADAG